MSTNDLKASARTFWLTYPENFFLPLRGRFSEKERRKKKAEKSFQKESFPLWGKWREAPIGKLPPLGEVARSADRGFLRPHAPSVSLAADSSPRGGAYKEQEIRIWLN